MSTRSTIAIRRNDGSVKKIYCHSDGYIQWNGSILQKYYSTADKVENLLALGNLSTLGPEIKPDDPHDWDLGYHDARFCRTYTSRGEALEFLPPDQMEEYNYIFDEAEGCWTVTWEVSKKPGEAAASIGLETIYDAYDTAYLIDKLAELSSADWARMAPVDENDWGVSLKDCMEAAREARAPINEQRAAHYAAYCSAYCD